MDEVHVWLASLNQTSATVETFFKLLTLDEKHGAPNYHFAKVRDYFTVGRGVLRIILGLYLNIPPDRIQLTYNKFGKPALCDSDEGATVCFNVSHSNDIVLCTVMRGRELGNDVECVRDNLSYVENRQKFFSSRESQHIMVLSVYLLETAIYTCCAHKETYIKAVGEENARRVEELLCR
ncbi:MAG: hypothetical protein NPIRA04_10990 [Nitrospirales bacterium]|nr:MAG: hypothetical protein NPIRA04_10990 [Nitrospirales bacterium]